MKSSLEIPAIDRPVMTPPKSAAESIQSLDPLAIPNWDEQVAALPGNTFFHTAAWARVLRESYGYKPVYLAKVEKSVLRGLLPIMEVNSWLTGRRGVSLPFTDACEVLSFDSETNRELFQAACLLGRKQRWKYVETRGNGSVPVGAESLESFYDHTLRLSGDSETVFAKFESSVRRAIRKAEKSGPKIEISRTLEGLRTFYELHCQTRQKHGVPPQPFSFFEAFFRNIIAANQGFVVIAQFEGKPIAASVFVHTRAKAIYKYGASDENFQNLRGANLVMWHAIQWFSKNGFSEFGFGRTDKSNEGLRRFKLGWGTEEHLLNYYRFDPQSDRFVPGNGETPGWRQQVFRYIPIPIARMIGSVLYRHVA